MYICQLPGLITVNARGGRSAPSRNRQGAPGTWRTGAPLLIEPAPADRIDAPGRPVCLVTGATSGIGEVVVGRLAAQGVRVLLVGRSAERGAETIARIRGKVPDADLRFYLADLSRVAEVRRLASEVRASSARLDVLLNDAGAIFFTKTLTAEGNEATFALNVLAPFLLTELLIDRLAAGHGRVVNVSSAAHRAAGLYLEDLDRAQGYSPWGAYGQSKLALLMLTYEATRRHAGLGVTVNACHPGFIRSRFGDDGKTLSARAFRVAKRLFGLSPEHGAETPTYVATAPELAGVTGQYFVRCRPHGSTRASRDPDAAGRLWEICLQRTNAYRAPLP